MPRNITKEPYQYNMRIIILTALVLLRPWPDPRLFGQLGAQLADAAVYLILLSVSLYAIIKMHGKIIFNKNLFIILYGLFLAIFLSLVCNVERQTWRDFVELYRPIYIITIIISFSYAARFSDPKITYNSFLRTLVIIGFLQLPFMAIQLLDLNAFHWTNFLYSWHKVEPSWLRATGTFGNPNHLAIFLSVAILAVILREKSKLMMVVQACMLFAGILFTGSLAVTVIVLPVAFFIYIKQFMTVKMPRMLIKTICKIIIIIITFGIISSIVGIQIIDIFPRLARLADILQDPQTTIWDLRNLTVRIEMWSNLWSVFWNGSIRAAIVGSGPSKELGLAVADNEWLFLFLRYGLLGLAFHVAFLIIVGWVLARAHDSVGDLGFGAMIILLLLTPFYESFSLIRMIPLYIIPFSLVIASRHQCRVINGGVKC